ncbi:MAG TPA: hypothetical protein VG435_14755 [Acidimicrobiales bacterium]|nr:hypothetical protein [Acidimicrobiales bacterium]
MIPLDGGTDFPYPQGDPGSLETAAGVMKGVATLLSGAAAKISGAAAQAAGSWSGPAASAFQDCVTQIHSGLSTLAGYHTDAADAITTYAGKLQGFQATASKAATDYGTAETDYRNSISTLSAEKQDKSATDAESRAADTLNTAYNHSYRLASDAVTDANQAALACATTISDLSGQAEATAKNQFLVLTAGRHAPLPSLLPPPKPGEKPKEGKGGIELSPVDWSNLLTTLYSAPAAWAVLRHDALEEEASAAKAYQKLVSALLRAGQSEGSSLPSAAAQAKAAVKAEESAEEMAEKILDHAPLSRVLTTSVKDGLPSKIADSLPDLAGKAADDLPLIGALFAAGGAAYDASHGEPVAQAVAGNAAGWITASLTTAGVVSLAGPGGWVVAGGIVLGVGAGMVVQTVIEHPKAVWHFVEHVFSSIF